jgi:hypothetical protein
LKSQLASTHFIGVEHQIIGVERSNLIKKGLPQKVDIRSGRSSRLIAKLRCKKCRLSGTGKKQFFLSIPHDEDEAEAFYKVEISTGDRRRFDRL